MVLVFLLSHKNLLSLVFRFVRFEALNFFMTEFVVHIPNYSFSATRSLLPLTATLVPLPPKVLLTALKLGAITGNSSLKRSQMFCKLLARSLSSWINSRVWSMDLEINLNRFSEIACISFNKFCRVDSCTTFQFFSSCCRCKSFCKTSTLF